jgi:hypothetical protein
VRTQEAIDRAYDLAALRQKRWRKRRNAGLVSISLDVDPELLATALNRVGIRVTQGRDDLARASTTCCSTW